MFGVVLWSDNTEHKAVIWCEDQGDLAFFRDEGADVTLDAGDLVEFEVSTERQFRYAHNPQLVVEEYHPELANSLTPAEPATSRSSSARIIPFSSARGEDSRPQPAVCRNG